jgi:hypothetical protein
LSTLQFFTYIPDVTEQLLLEASTMSHDAEDAVRWANLAEQVQDWQHFVQRADAAHLSPLLHRGLASLPHGSIPDDVKAHLHRSYNAVLARNILLYADLQSLCTIWEAEGIRIIPLKGIYLAEKVFGDIGVRHLSDLDLLVRQEELERCVAAASAHGWTVHRIKHHSAHFEERFGTYHPYKLIKGGTVAEMHVHIHRAGTSPAVRIEDFWQRSSAGVLSSSDIRELDPMDMLLHLCLHLHKHLMSTELKIVSFCDIREFIALHSPLDWDALLQHAKGYSAEQQVAEVLHLCNTFWECTIPEALTECLSQSKRSEVAHIFVRFFKDGALSLGDRQQMALKGRVTSFRKEEGTKGKLLFLRDYLFPEKDFLQQRHGTGPLVLLRTAHLLGLLGKTVRVASNAVKHRLR